MPDASPPPSSLHVEADLDGVRVLLRRRLLEQLRAHRRLRGAVVAAALAAAGLAAAASSAVAVGASIALVAAAVLAASLLPYGVLLLGQRRLVAASQVVITGARLRIGGQELALEGVASARAERGRLVLETAGGPVAVLEGLQAAELGWLAALIGEHAARRRAAVGEGAPAAPAALRALVAQAGQGAGE